MLSILILRKCFIGDHSILLTKLKNMRVSGKVLCLIHDFLTGRKQIVRVNRQMLSKGNVDSGVPQGWSLRPLLFLILFADNDDCPDLHLQENYMKKQ